MKLATVGTSFITEHFIQSLKLEGSFVLDTIYSRDPQKAMNLAQKYGVPNTCSDWMTLLHNPTLEVLYIATPNATHFGLARDAILAKKHVILEKPFVSNRKEFDALIALAKANGVYVFDAIIPMHLPNYAILKEVLPRIGALRLVNLAMVQRSSRLNALYAGEEPAIFSPQQSGGALMDLGVYPISVLVGLFGAPTAVKYTCSTYTNGIDLNGAITLTYPTFIANATIAKDSTGLNFTVFGGDNGYILLDKAPSQLMSVTLNQGSVLTELGVHQENLSMRYEIADFASVLRGERPERAEEWLAITRTVMDVMDACRQHVGLRFPADQEDSE
jgi:scyllo-inositol 2-dehydrogenase (NADP+)